MITDINEIKDYLIKHSGATKILEVLREKERWVEFLCIDSYDNKCVYRLWKNDLLITKKGLY